MSLEVGRDEGEGIVFPTIPARVVVRKAKGGKAQLGIEAPRKVLVMRDELVGDRRELERLRAVRGGVAALYCVLLINANGRVWLSEPCAYWTGVQAAAHFSAGLGAFVALIPDGSRAKAIAEGEVARFDARTPASGGDEIYAGWPGECSPECVAALRRVADLLDVRESR